MKLSLNFKSNLSNIFNKRLVNSFVSLSKMNFGGHGGMKMSADFKYQEEDGIKKRFDHVKYVRKLNKEQRLEENQGALFVDYLNDEFYPIHSVAVKHLPDPSIIYRKTVVIPYENQRDNTAHFYMDRTEIEARIYNILRQFDFIELEKVSLDADYEKDLGLDSLDWTALLTSIEYEFHTVFVDSMYSHWRTLNEVINQLENDDLIF